MVVLFLTPYLALSSALPPVAPIIAGQLHMSLQAVNLTSGLANAGYAAGTVVAVQFAQLLPQRRTLACSSASGMSIGTCSRTRPMVPSGLAAIAARVSAAYSAFSSTIAAPRAGTTAL